MNEDDISLSATDCQSASLGEQIERVIEQLPEDHLSLGKLLEIFGDEGLLILTILLTLVFLIPVSIPGVSTVFGAGILMIGVSRLIGRPLWLPASLKTRALPAEKLRPGLRAGLRWVQRMERISKPHRLPRLVNGRGMAFINNLAFILGALLLMAPFGFVPFSNTLPAVALLLLAVGFIQRDGGSVLLGHLANLGTVIYFAILIGGGTAALHQLWQHLAG
ncbi:exopolysaccharide biosynthesis protein [Lysobacter pythonis]|uniref:Exopolysaccharide biosynthesis protein n=1 Tax=Solilutibacter pythonis TaxID=2483112 RepID=A0A3M2HN90_9GAMM|nr:exopolysaccharide biosynthesis protein [Lysobacter pythonis]RMH88392.1 exopolysaccharide biosynthesis protein [Lysobacter pythonis]